MVKLRSSRICQDSRRFPLCCVPSDPRPLAVSPTYSSCLRQMPTWLGGSVNKEKPARRGLCGWRNTSLTHLKGAGLLEFRQMWAQYYQKPRSVFSPSQLIHAGNWFICSDTRQQNHQLPAPGPQPAEAAARQPKPGLEMECFVCLFLTSSFK